MHAPIFHSVKILIKYRDLLCVVFGRWCRYLFPSLLNFDIATISLVLSAIYLIWREWFRSFPSRCKCYDICQTEETKYCTIDEEHPRGEMTTPVTHYGYGRHVAVGSLEPGINREKKKTQKWKAYFGIFTFQMHNRCQMANTTQMQSTYEFNLRHD